jgi:intraflagellar transport protein 46
MSELDLSLKDKVQLCCSILDIPVRSINKKQGSNDKLIEASANLFALYSEFKNSQHFGRK